MWLLLPISVAEGGEEVCQEGLNICVGKNALTG